MKEYRKVVEFSFNNNKYNMYLDNNNKRFYLRVTDDGYLSYITIEELFDLIKHFEAIPNVMNISRDSPNEKFKFYPMIIMGGVTAILTLSIISVGLSIYNSNQTVNEFEKKSTVSELLSKEIVKDHVLYDYTNEIEKAFGEDYCIGKIKDKLYSNKYSNQIAFKPKSQNSIFEKHLSITNNKHKGILGLYYYYCYLLGVFPKENPKQYLTYSIRKEIKSKIDEIQPKIKELRKQIKYCKNIKERSEKMQNNLNNFDKDLAKEKDKSWSR